MSHGLRRTAARFAGQCSELPSAAPPTGQRRALALLSVPVLLFGTAWPVNKLALAGMPPLWFAAGRVSVGALVSFLLPAALAWACAILHARRHRWNLSPLQRW